MNFKTFQLIIDGHFPSEEDIEKVVDYGNNKYEQGNEAYLVESKIVDNRFLWMYCQHDNTKLYGDVVLDTASEKKLRNTRSKNKIELRQQLFLAYDIQTNLLYLSDISKKGFVKDYIAEILNIEVAVKNVYASLEEFQNSIKSLKRLKFTQYSNIQNMMDKNSIFAQQVNELGLDLPEKMTMQLEYSDTPIGKMKTGLQSLKKRRNIGYFKDIVLIGTDDQGVEQSFDFSSIIKNLLIKATKNENERYDENEVERYFFNKLRSADV